MCPNAKTMKHYPTLESPLCFVEFFSSCSIHQKYFSIILTEVYQQFFLIQSFYLSWSSFSTSHSSCLQWANCKLPKPYGWVSGGWYVDTTFANDYSIMNKLMCMNTKTLQTPTNMWRIDCLPMDFQFIKLCCM
jgi:hypothetical protein